MSDLNDLKLQGRIVRDAVLKDSKDGRKIALFILAVNQTKKNADGTYTETANYFPVSAFVNSEKFFSHLQKGQPLILEGYLKQITRVLDNNKYDSRLYICTRRIHLLFSGKKTEVKTDELPESAKNIPEDVILETENTQEDVFIGDDKDLF